MAPVMAAGLASVAQLGAVAAIQLYNHWDQVKELMLEGLEVPKSQGLESINSQLREIEERIEKVQKKGKTFSLVERDAYDKDVKEAERLRGEKKERESVDRLDGPSEAESEAGAGFAKAVRESGGKDAKAEYRAALEAQKNDKGLVLDEQDNTYRTPEELARKEFARAASGDKAARDRIGGVLDEGSESGDSDFARRIEKYSPETREKIKAGEDRLKQEQAADKQAEADRKKAEADRKKNQGDSDSAWEKEGREREKQAREIAAKANPNLKEDADRLAAKVDPEREKADAERLEATKKTVGDFHPDMNPKEVETEAKKRLAQEDDAEAKPKGLTGEEAVQQLKSRIKAKSPELTDEDAEGVAREQMERTKKEDPEERAAKIQADNLKQLKKVDPDIERNAQAAAAIGMATGKGTEDWSTKMREKLVKEQGMDEMEADDAVQSVLKGAKQKVNDRLASVRGPRNDPEATHSETMRTGDLTNKVQSAISNENPMQERKKQTSLLERQLEALATIAAKKSVDIEVN
jgi:hypothetical protein